jgi:hypothetical protein
MRGRLRRDIRFLGNATLVLSDAQGRPRRRLIVDPGGMPRIQFLDGGGKALREIVP